MRTSKVYSALVTEFLKTNLFVSATIQQENVKFTPPTNLPWAALWFIPNEKSVATLGTDGLDELTGVFQIDLNFPADSGRATAHEFCDVVESRFTSGKKLTYSGQDVTISSCGRSQGRNVDGFFRVPVTVSFRALLVRPKYPISIMQVLGP